MAKILLVAIAAGVVNGRRGTIIVVDPASQDAKARFPEVEDFDVDTVIDAGLARLPAKQPSRLTGIDDIGEEFGDAGEGVLNRGADIPESVATAASHRMARFNDQIDPDAPPSGLDSRGTTAHRDDPALAGTTDGTVSRHLAAQAAEQAGDEEAPASGRRRGRKPAGETEE